MPTFKNQLFCPQSQQFRGTLMHGEDPLLTFADLSVSKTASFPTSAFGADVHVENIFEVFCGQTLCVSCRMCVSRFCRRRHRHCAFAYPANPYIKGHIGQMMNAKSAKSFQRRSRGWCRGHSFAAQAPHVQTPKWPS